MKNKIILSFVFLSLLILGTLKTTAVGFDGAPRPGCIPGDTACTPGRK